MPVMTTKLRMVASRAGPIDLPRTWRSRVVPLWNRMQMSVIVVNTLPAVPKESGLMRPDMGPRIRPMSISRSTLGILVLAKATLKMWAKKMSRPSAIRIIEMSISDTDNEYNQTNLSLLN